MPPPSRIPSETGAGICNIMLTGHMMEEPTLTSQTNALGEAMRSYRSFQMPGIDMLCDWREYTAAKPASVRIPSVWLSRRAQRAVRRNQLGFRFQGT